MLFLRGQNFTIFFNNFFRRKEIEYNVITNETFCKNVSCRGINQLPTQHGIVFQMQ